MLRVFRSNKRPPPESHQLLIASYLCYGLETQPPLLYSLLMEVSTRSVQKSGLTGSSYTLGLPLVTLSYKVQINFSCIVTCSISKLLKRNALCGVPPPGEWRQNTNGLFVIWNLVALCLQ